MLSMNRRSLPENIVRFRLLLFLLVVFIVLVEGGVNALSAMTKPRILALHGKTQTAESFSKKIGGARRKLAREFDLTFLDGPIDLEEVAVPPPGTGASGKAWFLREPLEGKPGEFRYLKLAEAMKYVTDYASMNGPFDGLMGFSQGGTLAAALAASGAIPVRAVITAGAPHIEEAFVAASEWTATSGDAKERNVGLTIPKLHLAGETDAIISVESTDELCRRAGSGEKIIHEKGHLFPTKAVYVDQMVEFLKASLK